MIANEKETRRIEKLVKENEELKNIKIGLLKCNKGLKLSILNIYQSVLSYENSEIERQNQFIVSNIIIFSFHHFLKKLNSEIITENTYLRQICTKVIGVANKDNTKKEIINKQESDESYLLKKYKNFHRRTDTKVSLVINTSEDNLVNSEEIKETSKNLDSLANRDIIITDVRYVF